MNPALAAAGHGAHGNNGNSGNSAGKDTGSAEFAHARARARFGARTDEATWHRLEITRELGPLLELARAAPLARWVQGLAADAPLHAIEHALRQRWREAVAEVAGWVASEWQAAVRWCARLADLPAAEQWLRGEAVAAWTAHDDRLAWPDRSSAMAQAPNSGTGAAKRVSRADDSKRRPSHHHRAWRSARDEDDWRALLTHTQAARDDASSLLPLWLQAWRQRLPSGSAKNTIEASLVPLLAEHHARFASPVTVDGWATRRALAARLVALMRRHPAEPIEAFVFLALVGLELERLRAELAARAAFPKRTLHA
jgi:hypothetical protein